MSKAGQNTFTGISAQVDVALVHLLAASRDSTFTEIIVEGADWEDFTLAFRDGRHEDYEVKWHAAALSYAEIHEIVEKELKKPYGEKDKLFIVAKRVSASFLKDFKFIQGGLYWWEQFTKKDLASNPVVRRFLSKKWTMGEVVFLLKTEIVEETEGSLRAKLEEFFALELPFYLSEADQKSLVAITFKDIVDKGTRGEKIFRAEFANAVATFKGNIVSKSESFSPDVTIKNKVINLRPFLGSESAFQKLNDPRYLTPISDNPRLIFFICDELEKRDFDFEAFRFFLEKILIRHSYTNLSMRLLKKKWDQKKIAAPALLDFITHHYKKLLLSYNYDWALEIVIEIAKGNKSPELDLKILSFLQKDILEPFSKKSRRLKMAERGWREQEHVANLLDLFFKRAKDKKQFLDFIFSYFDFTSDDFENLFETHPKIHEFIRGFVEEAFEKRFAVVLRKVVEQFDVVCGGKFDGYEWIGSSVGQNGGVYSITDKGVVRFLFGPLCAGYYRTNEGKAWLFFKQTILDPKPGKDNPIFLHRALVPILLDRLCDPARPQGEKREALRYLSRILLVRQGIPNSSEVILDQVRRRDLALIGADNVMALIEKDAAKYKTKKGDGYPTNIFAILNLARLVGGGHGPAKDFLFELAARPEFAKLDGQRYHTFKMLASQGIPQKDPQFIVQLIQAIDFPAYLEGVNASWPSLVWDTATVLTGLILQDWSTGTAEGKQIIDSLLNDKAPSKVVLDFVTSPISELLKKDPLATYKLFEDYLQNKGAFRQTFGNGANARQNLVWLGAELAKGKNYVLPKQIIELCTDDPDPNTDDPDAKRNFHLQLKNEDEAQVHSISTVRGTVSWILQQLAVSNDAGLMAYTVDKTAELLDLDGSLAKRLGYSEPDLYVRLQALVPLSELAHPARRRILVQASGNSADPVKQLALRLLNSLDQNGGAPKQKAVCKSLAHVFGSIRDLGTDDAARVLNLIEREKIVDSAGLILFYAVFRKDHFKEIPFDETESRNQLERLCSTRNEFRPKLAWQFWRIAQDDEKNGTKLFDRIEPFWRLLSKTGDTDMHDAYQALEITLKWPSKYREHLEVLKEAVRAETNFLKKEGGGQCWGPRDGLAATIVKNSVRDFLEVFALILECLDETIHFYSLTDWRKHYAGIGKRSKADALLYKKIDDLLRARFPEDLGA